MAKFTHQAAYDTSVPGGMLEEFEQHLLSLLDIESRRLELADLYSRLLVEWTQPPETTIGNAKAEDGALSEDSFEVVEKDRLQQLVDKFESVTFNSAEVDEVVIGSYLDGLFEDEKGKTALQEIKEGIRWRAEVHINKEAPFNENTLNETIKGLLMNELLSDKKKDILTEFLYDSMVLGDIAGVLNMRYKDIRSWSWDVGNKGIPVKPRRELNGKYRVVMDEDILQALLVHYIGTQWNIMLHSILTEVQRETKIMTCKTTIPQGERDKRAFQIESCAPTYDHCRSNVEHERLTTYEKRFFLAKLPASVNERAGAYGDDEPDDEDDTSLSSYEAEEDVPTKETGSVVKQKLLRLLATETTIQRELHGQVALVQSDLQWFGTSLPHGTILTVLRFFGVSEDWIRFFKTYLEVPLDMSPSSNNDESANSMRYRRRGMPMAHALEKFFGELVLFGLDLAVKREADMYLYRMHDDLWLVGDPARCVRAWEALVKFTEVMGLEINERKTGSVYLCDEGVMKEDIAKSLPKGKVNIGFLKLDPASGSWTIDQELLDAHLKQLRVQLASCTSILSWIRTWNSCVGRFFSHNFGQPANCFGPAHVDAIFETYQRIPGMLFDDDFGFRVVSGVTKYLKTTIARRFSVMDVPDAFIFMPERFGGLGVRNPFIPLLLVRAQLEQTPAGRIEAFLAEEKREHEKHKAVFASWDPKAKQERRHAIYYEDATDSRAADRLIAETDADDFMSFEEYTRHREVHSSALAELYETLQERPAERNMAMPEELCTGLRRLGRTGTRSADLDEPTQWMVCLYAKELMEKCGQLDLLDTTSLPMGVLAKLKAKKVTWQMVLSGDSWHFPWFGS